MPDPCALCGNISELQRSHIIPNFAGRSIRRSSVTRAFRTPDTPHRRQQDIYKLPLLCHECEQRFSQAEGRFSAELFRPFLDHGESHVAYDSWLLEFAVSEAWRVGTVYRDEVQANFPQHTPTLETALQEWSAYLLGHQANPGARQHYLLLFDPPPVAGNDMNPSALDWFLMRGVDGSPVVGNNEIFVYTKLPGIALVSAVSPDFVAMLAGHEIAAQGHTTGTTLLPVPLRDFVLARAEEAMTDLGY